MESDLSFLKDQKIFNLALGNTFKKHHGNALHIVRYDFKPASVDLNQDGLVEVGESNEVTITLPHTPGSKNCTVYKGSKKPVQKECVLLYDPQSSTFVLERISSQVQVKKTRLTDNPRLQPATKIPKTMPGKRNLTPKPSKQSQDLKRNEVVMQEEKQTEQSKIPAHTSNNQLLSGGAMFSSTAISNDLSASDDDSSSSSSSSSGENSSNSSMDSPPRKNGSPKVQNQSQLDVDLLLSDSGSDSDSDSD